MRVFFYQSFSRISTTKILQSETMFDDSLINIISTLKVQHLFIMIVIIALDWLLFFFNIYY